MSVLFFIILVILLFISVLYLSFILQVKINITIAVAVISIKLKIFKFQKDFLIRLNYLELIKKYFFERRKERKNKRGFNFYKSIFKAFFIKNIDISSELFEDRLSIVVKINVVNVLKKKAILNE